MILRRLGNKSKLANKIESHFPKHTVYIEPFFGAGGMFFNKKHKAKYNILNDLDEDVFNLWKVLIDNKDELVKQIELFPVHNALFQFWKTNKETDPMRKALRFLFLSNFSLYGKMDTMKLCSENSKEIILSNIENDYINLSDCRFSNKDAIDFLKSIALQTITEEQNALIYCDPPYLGTGNNYSDSYGEDDLNNLIEYLKTKQWNFVISEFKSDRILNIASSHGLHVTEIGERKSIKNRSNEIIMTNYKTDQGLLF